MSSAQSPFDKNALSKENALALRLVRSQSVPHDFWLWLGGIRSTPTDNIASWISPKVLQSIEELLEPNLVEVNSQVRLQLKDTDAWIAAILGFTNQRALALKLHSGHPMMAVSLLPLYRSLATCKLPEALQQTRCRLSETLVLLGLMEELGDDFAQLLHLHGAPVNSPYAILSAVLKVDLVTTGALTCQAAQNFDPGVGEFEPHAGISNHPHLARVQTDLAWSDPKLLWQITAELMAKKAELVLPRQWADVAVPWTSINDHWNTLSHRLAHAALGSDGNEDADAAYNADDEIVSEMIDDLLAMKADVAEVSVDEVRQASEESSAENSADSRSGSDHPPTKSHPHGSHSPSVRGHRGDAKDTNREQEEEYPETDMLEPLPEPSVSKIAIVEINSNSDPMFVNIMRRQIATARNSDNSVCLVALSVESDDVADRDRIGAKNANGLLVWQDKLVNWLAEYPQVHQPFAFVTTEGQLVLSMQDIERTIATNVVREGLVTVLTGKRVEDQGALARVSIPARYYAGIGSAYPNAGFAAEQLVEATWRCLSAAQTKAKRRSKASKCFRCDLYQACLGEVGATALKIFSIMSSSKIGRATLLRSLPWLRVDVHKH